MLRSHLLALLGLVVAQTDPNDFSALCAVQPECPAGWTAQQGDCLMFAGWNQTRAVEICREKGAGTTVFPNEDKSRVPVFCVVRRKTQCDSELTDIMERMTRMKENMEQMKNELKTRDQRISLLEEALGIGSTTLRPPTTTLWLESHYFPGELCRLSCSKLISLIFSRLLSWTGRQGFIPWCGCLGAS